MKRTFKVTAVAIAAMLLWTGTTGTAVAGEDGNSVKVRVSDIKSHEGNIMIAVGDYTNPLAMVSAMVPAEGDSVECVLKGEVNAGDNVYVFHDANSNFMLDLAENGVPSEGCFRGKVEFQGNGEVRIELEYYSSKPVSSKGI